MHEQTPTNLRELVVKGRRRRYGSRARTAGAVLAVALALGLLFISEAAARMAAVGSTASCKQAHQTLAFASYEPALRTFDDPIEDSGNAPDFCASEVVTNDNQAITIGIHAHNRSGLLPGDSYTVFLDTDLNPSTGGGGSGAEDEITLADAGAQLKQWDGSAFTPASAPPPLMEWIPDYGPVLVLERTGLGATARFNLVFVSSNGQDADRAPDAGTWSYSLRPFALKMMALSFGPARAGRPFTARAVVLRSDFDEPLTEGTIGCAAKLAGRSLAGKGRFAGSRARCTWRLPKKARSKRLFGSVAVTFQGVSAKRGFSLRVK